MFDTITIKVTSRLVQANQDAILRLLTHLSKCNRLSRERRTDLLRYVDTMTSNKTKVKQLMADTIKSNKDNISKNERL